MAFPSIFPLEIAGGRKDVFPSLVPRCGLCNLFKGCNSPKMKVSGKGNKRILIVGEAPGAEEDLQGKQFVGKTGRYLQETLRRLGIEMRHDCWITNALTCRPPGSKIPKEEMISYCRPTLIKTIEELKPDVIIPLGSVAVESLIKWTWGHESEGIARWVGWQIPSRKINAYICPTYHPSYIVRFDDNQMMFNLSSKVWMGHLKAAVSLKGKPYERSQMCFKTQVTSITDAEKASREIELFIQRGRPISFDYETDRLKPDHKDAKILCCSISDGEVTIAFPWRGKAINSMKRLLQSPIMKWGQSIKFEERWTRKILKTRVNNWQWDGMLVSHALDARRGVSGLKFQSFVRFGLEAYDKDVEPYIKGEGGNGQNRMRECPLDKLLLYCGMDSLLEHKLCALQRKELGYE